MDGYSPTELLAKVRSLHAAAPLLARLVDEPGVHLVGGAVRDLLLDGQPSELDIVVEGDAAALALRLDSRARIYDRFGTSTVSLDGFTYDLASARSETYAEPGALPQVHPASLADDLRRRDFTVNAAAIALAGPRAGELRAVPSALEDLHARRLRVLHDGSFLDDPTRLLRLVRYASRLGFEVDPHTRSLVRDAVRHEALHSVSGSRIGAELRHLAREPDPVAALVALGELELDAAIDPHFGLTDPALAGRALGLLPADARRDLLAIALPARDVREADLAGLLERLAFEAADRELVLAVVSDAEGTALALQRAKLPSEIADAVGRAPPEQVALAGALGPAEQAREWLCRLRHVRLEINGDDLLAAGASQGPAIGRGIRAALAAKLDGRVAGRERELAEALRAAR